MKLQKSTIILLFLASIWFLQLTPILMHVLDVGPAVFPGPLMTDTSLAILIITSLGLSSYCLKLGLNRFKREKSGNGNQGTLFLSVVIIVFLVMPFVFAYIHQQEYQSFTQTILNEALMDEDFDELPPGTDPPGWDPVDGSWSTVTDGGTVVYYQDDNADKEALSISTTGNLSWTDYRFDVDVKFVEGNEKKDERGALLLFRYQGGNNYYFLYMKEYMDLIELHSHGDGAHVVDAVDCVLMPDIWYHVSIVVIGDIVDVEVDGVSYFGGVDMGGSFSHGSVAIGTSYYKVMFDNIYVDTI